MACKIAIVFFLSLFLRASFSLPIALDVQTVQTDSVPVINEKPVLDVETILHLQEESKLLQRLTTETVLNAFESVEAGHGKRIKRSIIEPGGVLCPGDLYQYGKKCLTKEEYDQVNDVGDDYDEQ
ncbi:hypothetical protein PYW08_004676 [Mythimna loreyi]|uniref:Uncharacterized protein n=1 Tax=Mythimna loreyi TaxID=667449 RepID=A0ACC2QQM6_9NEOP|nr:hypothetical protein PYW08_004676 [Mythimna loreyi]